MVRGLVLRALLLLLPEGMRDLDAQRASVYAAIAEDARAHEGR